MKKKYTCIFVIFLSYSFLNAQITVFASDITSTSIYLEEDDLYYTDGYAFYKFDISDIDLPTTLFVYDIEDDADYEPYTFTKNGNDIYYGTLDGVGFGYMGSIYKLNTSTATVIQLSAWPPHISAFNLEYKLGYLYYGGFSNLESPQNLRRLNLASTPPITPTTYVSIVTDSITINGFLMYFGTSDGKIYKKNMLIDTPETLVYDTGVGRILDLELFESQLYFIDDDGIKRINPLEAEPVAQLLASNTDYGLFFSLATKAYDDGDKYLFVTEVSNDRILKIDLNDPTLFVNETVKTKSMVFPNPTLNTITIKTASNIERITVYDLLGKSISETKNLNKTLNYNLDISNLNAGVYNLQIKTLKGIEFIKIIKQ